MRPLTAKEIRGAFVNATAEDLERMTLPGLHETLWEEREFLGWRDLHTPRLGYIVHWMNGKPVGVLLRATQASVRQGIAAMCSFCHLSQPSTHVRMFTAPRAGDAGRNGDTVGSYLCEDLACSLLIRQLPTRPLYPGYPDSHRGPRQPDLLEQRSAAVLSHVRGFTAAVLKSAA